jgi:hypothetical protein
MFKSFDRVVEMRRWSSSGHLNNIRFVMEGEFEGISTNDLASIEADFDIEAIINVCGCKVKVTRVNFQVGKSFNRWTFFMQRLRVGGTSSNK